LIVTGVSLLKSRGEDIRIIKKDGFKIAGTANMFNQRLYKDTGANMTRGLGRIIISLTQFAEKIKPDLVLSGFDIGANFAGAIVGAHLNIPVAHIQGGEVSGSIDESIRHALTKFAHIHFPATKRSALRIRQMGEDPRFIFIVGCPSIDAILQAPRNTREDVYEFLKLNPREPYVLVVQHPVTTEIQSTKMQIETTLKAVTNSKVQAVVLYPNNDAGAETIMRAVKQNKKIKRLQGLPPEQYANVLRFASALIGNSSSGIHETATFKVPSINIGSRQKGRERPYSVLDVPHNTEQIEIAINKALFDKTFLSKVQKIKNPYGDGHSAERIVSILKKLNLSQVPIQKKFFDY
jgi:GDP/UDP-N,N'-diacetylbacillosamine 2-epimerase (hydrolysing)